MWVAWEEKSVLGHPGSVWPWVLFTPLNLLPWRSPDASWMHCLTPQMARVHKTNIKRTINHKEKPCARNAHWSQSGSFLLRPIERRLIIFMLVLTWLAHQQTVAEGAYFGM